MSPQVQNQQPHGQWDAHPMLRIVLAALVIATTALYTAGVLTGKVSSAQKIDATHLALLVFAFLLLVVIRRPAILKDLRLEWRGIKLRLELEQVREKQADQEKEIEMLQDVVPLLLSKEERELLRRLETETNPKEETTHALRSALRRLRSIGIIEMRKDDSGKDRRIAQMKPDGSYDLAAYVRLTKSGERWAKRIEDSERPGKEL
jgi:hypothetical protein